MKIYNKILALCCGTVMLTGGCLTLSAQEADVALVTQLNVNLKYGTKEVFQIPDTPSVTFEGDSLVVTSTRMSSGYLRSEVSHFNFDKGPDLGGVETVAKDADFTFKFTDNLNVIIAAKDLKSVEVFNSAGLRVASARAAEGVVTLNVANLAPGIYVVAPDCHPAVKIVKH